MRRSSPGFRPVIGVGQRRMALGRTAPHRVPVMQFGKSPRKTAHDLTSRIREGDLGVTRAVRRHPNRLNPTPENVGDDCVPRFMDARCHPLVPSGRKSVGHPPALAIERGLPTVRASFSGPDSSTTIQRRFNVWLRSARLQQRLRRSVLELRGEGSNLQHPAPKADVLPIELPRTVTGAAFRLDTRQGSARAEARR